MKDRNRSIKKSNYLVLALIIVAVVIVVFLLRNIYISKQNNELNVPVIRNYITNEIKSNEIFNYLNENENSFIYIGVSSDMNCRTLEKNIKNYVNGNGLNDKIIYLNLTDDENIDSFYSSLNSIYDYSEVISGYPTFIYFKDGKIADVLSGTITVDDLKEFVSFNGIDK